MTSPTPPIQPALSSRQWSDLNGPMFFYGQGEQPFVYSDGDDENGIGISRVTAAESEQWAPITLPGADRHALAALCLYQQPFGFSQADVETLLDAANSIDGEWPEEHEKWQDVPRLRSLASRISALLPQP